MEGKDEKRRVEDIVGVTSTPSAAAKGVFPDSDEVPDED